MKRVVAVATACILLVWSFVSQADDFAGSESVAEYICDRCSIAEVLRERKWETESELWLRWLNDFCESIPEQCNPSPRDVAYAK